MGKWRLMEKKKKTTAKIPRMEVLPSTSLAEGNVGVEAS